MFLHQIPKLIKSVLILENQWVDTLFPNEEKIKSRYQKALKLIPELVELCDIVHIYDNTNVPFRIFKKRKDIYFHWENKYWSFSDIEKLTGIDEYEN